MICLCSSLDYHLSCPSLSQRFPLSSALFYDAKTKIITCSVLIFVNISFLQKNVFYTNLTLDKWCRKRMLQDCKIQISIGRLRIRILRNALALELTKEIVMYRYKRYGHAGKLKCRRIGWNFFNFQYWDCLPGTCSLTFWLDPDKYLYTGLVGSELIITGNCLADPDIACRDSEPWWS